MVHWTLGALLYRTRFFPLRWDSHKTFYLRILNEMFSYIWCIWTHSSHSNSSREQHLYFLPTLQNRSWELCHGMGHHTSLLAQFYRRPSKKTWPPSAKAAQMCPLPPPPYATAPPPTCQANPSKQGRQRSPSFPLPLLTNWLQRFQIDANNLTLLCLSFSALPN